MSIWESKGLLDQAAPNTNDSCSIAELDPAPPQHQGRSVTHMSIWDNKGLLDQAAPNTDD